MPLIPTDKRHAKENRVKDRCQEQSFGNVERDVNRINNDPPKPVFQLLAV